MALTGKKRSDLSRAIYRYAKAYHKIHTPRANPYSDKRKDRDEERHSLKLLKDMVERWSK